LHGGGAGNFDVDLPLVSPAGIECRSGGGPNFNTHQVVFQFPQPATFTNASVTPQAGKTAQITGTSGKGTQEVKVNLGNVSNAQTLSITLTGVSGAGTSPTITVPMAILTGDTTADGSVNSADITQVKSQSGTPVTISNFREDLNTDGTHNSADITLVKSRSGTALPPP
jgi:ABC-type sugar transport system ATPase subunit